MSKIKHAGCWGCGNKEQTILTSVSGSDYKQSVALCDACKAKKEKKEWQPDHRP